MIVKQSSKTQMKLQSFLNTIAQPSPYKEKTGRMRNTMESSRFASNQNFSISVRKNCSINQQLALPSITNRRSLILEPIQYQISTLDERSVRNRNNKNVQKNMRKFKNLSIANNSNTYINMTNEEQQIIQSITNSPKKIQQGRPPPVPKTRKQLIIEFLRGEHQTMQFSSQAKKTLKDQSILPSFIIKKYQELQF